MRKIIVEAEVSINGAMGSDNMDFWSQVFSYHSPDVNEYLNDLLFAPDALLMGRKTYETFAQVWPTREGKDAEKINSMPKYVASRTLQEPLDWNATLIKGVTHAALRRHIKGMKIKGDTIEVGFSLALRIREGVGPRTSEAHKDVATHAG